MELIFIGTGGGRVNLIKQFRGTGGFLIKGTLNFHVDPGPGALSNMVRLGEDPMKTDVLVATHCHIDHCSDAGVLCEGMTNYGMEKKGILIGSKNTLEGDRKGDRGVSLYHQGLPTKRIVAVHGGRIEEEVRGKKFQMEIIGIRHDEESNFGFKLHLDGKTIGYVSDTEYFDGLGPAFSGCDILVVNNLKPMQDGIPDHLSSTDTVKILKVAKPSLCLLTHLGMKFSGGKAGLEAERMGEEAGVKVVAGRDGMKVLFLGDGGFAFGKAGEKKPLEGKEKGIKKPKPQA